MKMSTIADRVSALARRPHHIGFVVESIATLGEGFAASVGATWDGRIIEDPGQGARVSFLEFGPGQVALELVQPSGPDSPLEAFLGKGGGLHHVCFEVDSLDDELERSVAQRAHLVRPPMPAVAFNGRRIAWVYTRQRLLIEYLEAEPTPASSPPDGASWREAEEDKAGISREDG